MITQERLKDILYYHPESGDWVWLARTSQTDRTGLQAGTLHHSGYWNFHIAGRMYTGHRLAVLYMMGKWPEGDVDHKDLNKSNTVWTNLRPASHAGNRQNRRVRKDSVSGLKGVGWYPSYGRYTAYIKAHGKKKFLGYFDKAEDAHAAYAAAARALHGEFARI